MVAAGHHPAENVTFAWSSRTFPGSAPPCTRCGAASSRLLGGEPLRVGLNPWQRDARLNPALQTPAQAMIAAPLPPHTFENVGDQEFRVVTVELKNSPS